MRKVEIIVKGACRGHQEVRPTTSRRIFNVKVNIDKSSWVASREVPQLHTNPVNVPSPAKATAVRRSDHWLCGRAEHCGGSATQRICRV